VLKLAMRELEVAFSKLGPNPARSIWSVVEVTAGTVIPSTDPAK